MKTNTWIKRSANNVMWTLFCSGFLSHSLQRFLIASVQSELNLKYECCWKQSDIKANLHLLYLSVCTRLLVLYVVWMNSVWGEDTCESSWLQRRNFRLVILFKSVYFCCWFVVFFLFFLFACQKYILMLMVTSL